MNLSIIVPTKNRYYYLKKLLSYYSKINYEGNLVILDSSDLEIKKKVLNEINLSNNIRIQYFHDMGLPFGLIKKFINEIDTKYVVFSGDDDYFTKNGLVQCINFLEKNLNFLGCNGEGISVHSSTDKKKIDFILDYNQAKIFASSSQERLKKQFSKYKVPIFSIFKLENFKKFLDPVPAVQELNSLCPDKAIADEYMVETAMVAYGNIEKLDFPYLVRHIHKDRNIGNLVPDFKKDWIKSKDYNISVEYFYKKSSELISLIDGIDNSDSIQFFKKIYREHLLYELEREKKLLVKLFLSNIIYKFQFIKNIRHFFIRNIFSNKKYNDVIKNNEYKLIIQSIEGKL